MTNLEMPKGIVANLDAMQSGQEHMRSDISPAKVARVPLSQIIVGERKRKPSNADVERLYADIYQHGLLQPIGVQMHGVGKYKLLYGRHRLMAFEIGLSKAQGAAVADWNKIPAIVYGLEMPKFAAELKEIAENLMRKNLTQPELEEHRSRYAALLKRNNLTVEEEAKRGPKNSAHDEPNFNPKEKPSVFAKMEADLGVTRATVKRDFAAVSRRAQAVAREEGLPKPKPITPTSSAEVIEAALKLSERHTEARQAAEVGDPRKVMPIQPQPPTQITVRIDLTDPASLVAWFADRLTGTNKPVSADYIRNLAAGLLALVARQVDERGG
jgi:ParB-like chromosome segregation protein Spo0J